MDGTVTRDYGTPYDFQSIMHYDLDAFLVEGETGNVIEVKASVSPQPTKIGNTELSQYDTIKIQKAYGCEACGGPQAGHHGSLQAADTGTEGTCLWWLTSPSGHQIGRTSVILKS